MTSSSVFLLIILSINILLSEKPPEGLAEFADYLEDVFKNHSHSEIIEESIATLLPSLRIRSESAEASLRSTTSQLTKLFTDRIQALRKLAESAENASEFYEIDVFEEDALRSDDEAFCIDIQSKIRSYDVRFLHQQDENRSGIHINVESYTCDPVVIRDYEWTGSDNIEKTFESNKKQWPDMGYQYVGTYSGVTRMFPARQWIIEPPSITVDLFDPKFRPWFVNAESPPKDVVFLIDYSGSMKGPTMHLTKITLMYLMATLNPNDYFYGLWFNNNFAPVLACSQRFLPATTSNKKIFYEKLAEQEEKDQAFMGPAIKFSLDALRQFISSDMKWARSGGHKMVMLFTDGIDEWPESVINEEVIDSEGDKVRIFGFAMGWGTGSLPMLHQLACLTNATYAVVDSISDVKPQARSYLDHLAYVHGLSLFNIEKGQKPLSWTNLYMDSQGSGPTVSLSTPIPVRSKKIWSTQRMAGVAAVDINVKEISEKLPSGDQMYGFVVDNNGIAVYHPKLQMPKTEVHCVRRSACYDASSVKAKAGAGLRVQYGFSDERVYRLVGLIDSIPTVDVMDLEDNSTAFIEMRNRVIDRNCTEEAIQDGERELYCSNIPGTPFSVVIVNHHKRQSIVNGNKEEKSIDIQHNMVSVVMTKRDVCNWSLDHLPLHLRFDAFTKLDNCQDSSTPISKALGNALEPWISSWPLSDDNLTCESSSFPDGIPSNYFVNSFVHTRQQITAFYPKCTLNFMKEVLRKFDTERYTQDNSTDLQFTIRSDIIVVYRPILDRYSNRIATVAAQWRIDYVNHLFQNWIKKHKQQWKQFSEKDVLLVTKSGWVIGSTKRSPAHLTAYDPQLFYSLKKQKMITVTRHVDVQAECIARRTAPWASPAPSNRGPIRAIGDLIAKFLTAAFWIDLYYFFSHTVTAQPTWSAAGKCQFQKIKPFERCSIESFEYKMTLNITAQIETGGNCLRFLSVHPVAHTTLTLIIADKPCAFYKAPQHFSYKPRKMVGCEVVTSYYRQRRTDLNYNITNSEESYPQCLEINNSHLGIQFSLVSLMFLFLLS